MPVRRCEPLCISQSSCGWQDEVPILLLLSLEKAASELSYKWGHVVFDRDAAVLAFSTTTVHTVISTIYEFICICLLAGAGWGCLQVRTITEKTSVNIQRTGGSCVKNISNFVRNCQIGFLKVPVSFCISTSN